MASLSAPAWLYQPATTGWCRVTVSLSGQQLSVSVGGKLQLPSSCTLLLGDRGLTRSAPAAKLEPVSRQVNLAVKLCLGNSGLGRSAAAGCTQPCGVQGVLHWPPLRQLHAWHCQSAVQSGGRQQGCMSGMPCSGAELLRCVQNSKAALSPCKWVTGCRAVSTVCFCDLGQAAATQPAAKQECLTCMQQAALPASCRL